MPNPLNSQKSIAVVAVLIVVTAGVLGLTKYKLPGANSNIYTNTSNTNVYSSTVNTNTSSTQTNTNVSTYSYPGKLSADKIEKKQIRIHLAKGDIIFTLDAAQSPIAVSNFVYLTEQKYYDRIKWHRVEDWVVQMGDPQTKDASVSSQLWGTGGPGYTIPDEPVTGEYLRGTVAMAKTAAPNSAGSQIFILKKDYPLGKTYQIFGQVTTGLDIVDGLSVGDEILSVTVEPAS